MLKFIPLVLIAASLVFASPGGGNSGNNANGTDPICPRTGSTVSQQDQLQEREQLRLQLENGDCEPERLSEREARREERKARREARKVAREARRLENQRENINQVNE
jgi:hypothetical protein